MNWREVEFGIFPSSQRRGGCGINKSREATEEAADGREARARQREAVIVVSSAKCLELNSFAELTTPAAPISERIHFIDGASTPPLRGGEHPELNVSPIFTNRPYSGIFPCFLGGLESRLVSSIRKAEMSFLRVYFGSMISSMKPCSAAMYGFANFSRNSSTFSWRFLSISPAEASSRR